jgi:hypothetical protein
VVGVGVRVGDGAAVPLRARVGDEQRRGRGPGRVAGCHCWGTWRHIFYKVRAGARRLLGRDGRPLKVRLCHLRAELQRRGLTMTGGFSSPMLAISIAATSGRAV